jgi:hypothetical protein
MHFTLYQKSHKWESPLGSSGSIRIEQLRKNANCENIKISFLFLRRFIVTNRIKMMISIVLFSLLQSLFWVVSFSIDSVMIDPVEIMSVSTQMQSEQQVSSFLNEHESRVTLKAFAIHKTKSNEYVIIDMRDSRPLILQQNITATQLHCACCT